MAIHEAPPFARGESKTNLSFWLGRTFEIEDNDISSGGVPSKLSGNAVTVRVVKNSAAAALLPGRLGKFKAGTNCTEIDGYGTVTGDLDVVGIDEYLPAAGVPVGEYFYVVTKGPWSGLTDLAGGANNLIPEGTPLIALTGATSGATTAGRVAPLDVTATNSANQSIVGVFGRALSAKTTGQTNGAIRIYMMTHF